ncbi:hypothetical protein AVEN_83909-1 [Araneus ventricosus]|uniref:Uncharacterized protein n=1 Tax=Araneus ventricosus TaxID=182803 RepID=A0A4Y2I459_ARAVE|nr:hypothetical protein AVEN_83909-1 [Araneus ventricosus]
MFTFFSFFGDPEVSSFAGGLALKGTAGSSETRTSDDTADEAGSSSLSHLLLQLISGMTQQKGHIFLLSESRNVKNGRIILNVLFREEGVVALGNPTVGSEVLFMNWKSVVE